MGDHTNTILAIYESWSPKDDRRHIKNMIKNYFQSGQLKAYP